MYMVRAFSLNVSRIIFCLIATVQMLQAYPPAPPYVIEGVVRDDIGDPYGYAGAALELYHGDTLVGQSLIRNDLWPEVNFRISVALSAVSTLDIYKPTALKPFSPLTAKVVVGEQTFLPFKVGGGGLSVGNSGETGFVELTLGLDSDDDGLPDTWEEWQLAQLGIYPGNPDFDLSLIDPDGDFDGDGVSNYIEYLAGTYATDAESRFQLSIVDVAETGEATLEFLAVIDRKYKIERLSEGQTWEPVPFKLEGQQTAQLIWLAPDVAIQRVRVPGAPSGASLYRLTVR